MVLMLASTCSHAIIQTQPPFIVLSEHNQQAKLTILNTDSHRGYIAMFAKEIHCKNESCSSYNETETVNAKKLQFSTPKFILDPGQKRSVTVFWEGEFPSKLINFSIGGYDHAQEAEQITQSKSGNKTFTIKYRTEHSMKLQVIPAGTSIGTPTIIIGDDKVMVKNPQSAPLNISVRNTCINNDCKAKKTSSKMILQGNAEIPVDLKSNYRTSIKYFNPLRQAYEELYNTEQGIIKNRPNYRLSYSSPNKKLYNVVEKPNTENRPTQ